MPGVFISYRRDDSAGFAGRLADDLSEVFGADLVFMDVTGIEPGIDFRKAIEQNVADCDAVVAVIGRGWTGMRGAGGGTRLSDSADFVRLELAAALARDVPVIPALVDGAAMPGARDLPPDLEPLAWRNAVELRHSRWDADLAVLVGALQKVVPRKASAPGATERPAQRAPATHGSQQGSRLRLWAVVAAALIAIVALGLLRPWRAAPDAGRPPGGGTSDHGTGVGHGAAPATLRVDADVTVASARYQILGARIEPVNGQLAVRFAVRMTSLQGPPANFSGNSFRLLVDDVPMAPSETLNDLVDGYSAKEGEVVFQVDPRVTAAVLQVTYGNESTRIPIDLTQAVPGTPAVPVRKKQPGPFPMTLAAGREVHVAPMTYRVLSATVSRRNMEQLALTVAVRATNHGGAQANFWDASFRLEVDGIPRAPISGPNELVDANGAREGEVVFVFDDTVETLVLLVGHGSDKTRVPLLTR